MAKSTDGDVSYGHNGFLPRRHSPPVCPARCGHGTSPGYEVHETESGEQAAALMQRSVMREGCWRQPLVLHADNGAAMKSQTLQMKLYELNITPSHSRPRVSNDNAYAESLFRTPKYVPQWPSSGFRTLGEARQWVDKFTHWYNEEHRHSGVRYVTPGQRHRGEDNALLKQRDELYRMAQKAHAVVRQNEKLAAGRPGHTESGAGKTGRLN